MQMYSALIEREKKKLLIFDGDQTIEADNINAYLVDAPDVFVWRRAEPLSEGVPRMTLGNLPVDGGNLILSPEEREQLLKNDPKLEQCIRRFVGARDFINGDEIRYCLWLKDINPSVYRKSREIMRRLDAVREFRLASKRKATYECADRPFMFGAVTQIDDEEFIVIPRVSSERRQYIPIGFMTSDVIVSDAVQIIPAATLYHFGVLTSSVHMAWMRRVCGRLRADYRYSGIVYNTFPWCTPTAEQRVAIEKSARNILDARAKYSGASLADIAPCPSSFAKRMPKTIVRCSTLTASLDRSRSRRLSSG